MEQLKRDYVYTLQSCVTIPSGDVTDGMSVKLYGGDVVGSAIYKNVTIFQKFKFY